MRLKIRSLNLRFTIFLLVPVAVLLLAMGLVGFWGARTLLVELWSDAAVSKLRAASHSVDMRLGAIKEQMRLFGQAAPFKQSVAIQNFVLQQIAESPGVSDVHLTWTDQPEPSSRTEVPRDESVGGREQASHGGRLSAKEFKHAHKVEVNPPEYDSDTNRQIVSLASNLIDAQGRIAGRLTVVVHFEYLVENVVELGWWQSSRAMLMDLDGHVLTCTLTEDLTRACHNDPLRQEVLARIKKDRSGTIYTPGDRDLDVAGFSRLVQAPWVLVMVARKKDILQPIIRFRDDYLVIGAGFILFILLIIRQVTTRTASAIHKVSRAAGRVAQGRFDEPLPVKSNDEVGDLTRSFNAMITQLKERRRLKRDMELAMEVQQSLLPNKPPRIPGLDVAGKSVYCEETGGDYFDFLMCQRGGYGFVVGDVSDHGLQSALLMATARALLRQRASMAGTLTEIISDVNQQLTLDVNDSGSFMTMLFMRLDVNAKTIRWISAGHDPALVYHPRTDRFIELEGRGLALGIDTQYPYREHLGQIESGQIVLLGTDGLWEARNHSGEMFGKQRVQESIRENHQKPAEDIVAGIMEDLETHCRISESADDITLVVIKVL